MSGIPHGINAERLLLLAWTRAILLQLAHPLVAAAVSDHSTFRGSTVAAVSRLHHTVHAMLAISFGTDDDCERALEVIRGIHRRVNGVLPAACGRFPADTPYSAEDPSLLLWVHVTLIESIVLVYDRVVAPLDDEARDRYCAASAEVDVALGVRPEDAPRSWNDVQASLRREYDAGSIVVSGQARRLASALLSPLPSPWSVAAAPLSAVATLLAAGLLPAPIRLQYGFAWSDRRQRTFDVVMRGLQRLRRALPRWIAWWPEARLETASAERAGA